MRVGTIACACVASVGLCSTMQSSASAQTGVAFAVASIKPNTGGSASVSFGPVPGGYSATNVSLRLLVEAAFRTRAGQVIGGPDWIASDRFDIAARAPDGAPSAAIFQMLRTLLEHRFRLRTHIESREGSIYALVRTRSDGPLGPQLRLSSVVCAVPGTSGNPCRLSGTIGAATGSVQATGQTLTALASYLGANVDRVVVDRTGLTGLFDFHLAWTADDFRAESPNATAGAPPGDRAALFTALQEQLGLKLEPAKGPVEFVVIDGAERPTAD